MLTFFTLWLYIKIHYFYITFHILYRNGYAYMLAMHFRCFVYTTTYFFLLWIALPYFFYSVQIRIVFPECFDIHKYEYITIFTVYDINKDIWLILVILSLNMYIMNVKCKDTYGLADDISLDVRISSFSTTEVYMVLFD